MRQFFQRLALTVIILGVAAGFTAAHLADHHHGTSSHIAVAALVMGVGFLCTWFVWTEYL